MRIHPRDTPHLVCVGDFAHWHCRHCGFTFNPYELDPHAPPLRSLPIDAWLDLMKGFMRRHAECEPPKPEPAWSAWENEGGAW